MPEYHVLRVFVGAAQLFLAATIIHRNITALRRFAVAMICCAVANLVPAAPAEPWYKYGFQAPAYLVVLIAYVSATVEVFQFMRRVTFRRERVILAAWATVVGLIPCAAGWVWVPVNSYQTFMITRQYLVIAVAVAFWAAWAWVRWLRPVPMSTAVRVHGAAWGFWMVIASVAASTTKGGIAWSIWEWSGGFVTWRVIGDGVLAAQLSLVLLSIINLRLWLCATRFVPGGTLDYPGQPASLPVSYPSA